MKLRLTNSLREKDNQVKYLTKFIQKELTAKIDSSLENEKKFYEKLRISSLNELILNIAHHWRQPLSIISVAATSLQLYKESQIIDKDSITKNTRLINDTVQNLSKTLESFDSFKMPLDKKEVYKISHVINTLKELINNYDIKVKINLEEDISLYGKECELLEVLFNLITNSYETFKERKIIDKKVYLDLKTKENLLIIKLKDNAKGIDEKIISRIFEPYFSTKHHSYGIGLGLYIVYSIINQKMKGEIKVKNINFKDEKTEKKYEGVEFEIIVPKYSSKIDNITQD